MTTTIPANLVKELREQTGAGMMDCKRALQEADGDLEAAKRLLREQGLAQAGKRAGRETTEGVVLARVEKARGTLVAVGCETEPVSKNEEFQGFAEQVLQLVDREGPDAPEQVEDERVGLVAKLGENVVVRGAARFEAGDGEVVAAYVHPPANKIGVLVHAKGGSQDAARRVAMHIAAARPMFATRDEVPEEAVAAEREIYEKLPDVQSKPEDVRGKIVEGMLAKRYFAESVLADQPWVHEPGKTVGQALADEGLEVLEFARFALAE
jgi:elongation factor Ts